MLIPILRFVLIEVASLLTYYGTLLVVGVSLWGVNLLEVRLPFYVVTECIIIDLEEAVVLSNPSRGWNCFMVGYFHLVGFRCWICTWYCCCFHRDCGWWVLPDFNGFQWPQEPWVLCSIPWGCSCRYGTSGTLGHHPRGNSSWFLFHDPCLDFHNQLKIRIMHI